MSTNFKQWNPSATNQQSDGAYATSATAGAATNSIFASQVANKLFFQVSTFVAAFAQALSAQGLNVSDTDLNALASLLSGIVISGIGYSPTFGNVTMNALTTASIDSTTGILSRGGIQSGQAAVSQGLYGIVDSTLTLRSGYTGSVASASGRNIVGGIIV